MTLHDYTLQGGPCDGKVIRDTTPFRNLLIPDAIEGTHWYEHRSQVNTATGERRDVLVYIGKGFNGKRPDGAALIS